MAENSSTPPVPPAETNYNAMTVEQLKEKCRSTGKKVSGNKLELIARLTEKSPKNSPEKKKIVPKKKISSSKKRKVVSSSLNHRSDDESDDDSDSSEVGETKDNELNLLKFLKKITSNGNFTLIDRIIFGGSFSEVKAMLEDKNVNIDSTNTDGECALHMAVVLKDESKGFKITKLLIKKGAKLNIRDKNGSTPLLYAVANNNLNCTKALLEAGADPSLGMHDNSKTPFFTCVYKGFTEIARLMLERGAVGSNEVFYIQGDEAPALVLAVEGGHTDLVRLLLEFKADPNARLAGSGTTALICAVFQLRVEIIKILIDAGADVNLADHEFTNPSEALIFAKMEHPQKNAEWNQVKELLSKAGAKKFF